MQSGKVVWIQCQKCVHIYNSWLLFLTSPKLMGEVGQESGAVKVLLLGAKVCNLWIQVTEEGSTSRSECR